MVLRILPDFITANQSSNFKVSVTRFLKPTYYDVISNIMKMLVYARIPLLCGLTCRIMFSQLVIRGLWDGPTVPDAVSDGTRPKKAATLDQANVVNSVTRVYDPILISDSAS